ncbi:hypothetical protein FDUTEX481_04050 [Tolypothrix sp. PCC 7601]|nr:hypothetical protein FDUTEX481_04050 [Tolypothrix sp. PCC 7601]
MVRCEFKHFSSATIPLEKADLSAYKGLPRNKLFHLVGRASCLPHKLGGQDVHPIINTGIFFYLQVPKII